MTIASHGPRIALNPETTSELIKILTEKDKNYLFTSTNHHEIPDGLAIITNRIDHADFDSGYWPYIRIGRFTAEDDQEPEPSDSAESYNTTILKSPVHIHKDTMALRAENSYEVSLSWKMDLLCPTKIIVSGMDSSVILTVARQGFDQTMSICLGHSTGSIKSSIIHKGKGVVYSICKRAIAIVSRIFGAFRIAGRSILGHDTRSNLDLESQIRPCDDANSHCIKVAIVLDSSKHISELGRVHPLSICKQNTNVSLDLQKCSISTIFQYFTTADNIKLGLLDIYYGNVEEHSQLVTDASSVQSGTTRQSHVGSSLYRLSTSSSGGNTPSMLIRTSRIGNQVIIHDCVICLSNSSNVILFPCQHWCMCNDCVTSLITSSTAGSNTLNPNAQRRTMITLKCPLCRTPVRDIVVLENLILRTC